MEQRERDDDQRERRNAREPDDPVRAVTRVAPRRDHRDRADQERLGAGVGPVVQAQRVRVRVVQCCHPHGRRHRAGGRDDHEWSASPSREHQHPEDDQWPHDVELLFDRQRPKMEQR